ncbi:MAG: hypothetical protein IJ092_03095 [Atopobiaceae bacterium]|nr:hypothetical protein [Atopobiaceae bacterium]
MVPIFTSAADLFEATRDAVRERDRSLRMLRSLEQRDLGAHGGSIAGGGVSGGARDVRALTDARLDHESRLHRSISECDELVDYACAVLYGADQTGESGGLYVLIDHAAADVLCLHYCQDMTWDATAMALGLNRRDCFRARLRALEYIDSHGVAAVIAGDGGAAA